jgi:hypothetical protein
MQVLNEEKLAKSATGINIPLTNPLDVLQRRPGFKVGSISKKKLQHLNANILHKCNE